MNTQNTSDGHLSRLRSLAESSPGSRDPPVACRAHSASDIAAAYFVGGYWRLKIPSTRRLLRFALLVPSDLSFSRFARESHMPLDLQLRCRCGHTRGVASNVSPSSGLRFVCYCRDCQAFAHFLHRAD